MIRNLFSIFDPHSSIEYSFNWLRIFIPLFFFPNLFWLKKSKIFIFFYIINQFILKEFNNFTKNNYNNIYVFISILLILLFINFTGLFPYIFTSTRHITISLPLSLSIWLRIILFYWLKITKLSFAHLVPLNTPPALIIFMVLIETIRNIIRPLTLAIRLSANIIAGHLLLCLLGSTGQILRNNLIIFLIFTQILLFTLEIAVSIIQSYVFITLISLYSNEL